MRSPKVIWIIERQRIGGRYKNWHHECQCSASTTEKEVLNVVSSLNAENKHYTYRVVPYVRV